MNASLESRTRAFAWLACASALAALCLYVVFIRTPHGQRWDDRAYLGSLLASLEARQRVTSILHEISISTLVFMVILLLVIGLLRKRLATGILTAIAFGGAVLSAEVLKRVLHRPDLASDMNSLVNETNIDTYPSGHATIAISFALGLQIVSSLRARLAVAALGMLWAAWISMAALVAGWHRPSDIAGGIALGTCWMAGAAALATRRRGRLGAPTGDIRWLPAIAGGALLLALVVVTFWISRGDPTQIPVTGGLPAFLLGQALIGAVAIGAVALFAYLLRGLSFDSRGRTFAAETAGT